MFQNFFLLVSRFVSFRFVSSLLRARKYTKAKRKGYVRYVVVKGKKLSFHSALFSEILIENLWVPIRKIDLVANTYIVNIDFVIIEWTTFTNGYIFLFKNKILVCRKKNNNNELLNTFFMRPSSLLYIPSKGIIQ